MSAASRAKEAQASRSGNQACNTQRCKTLWPHLVHGGCSHIYIYIYTTAPATVWKYCTLCTSCIDNKHAVEETAELATVIEHGSAVLASEGVKIPGRWPALAIRCYCPSSGIGVGSFRGPLTVVLQASKNDNPPVTSIFVRHIYDVQRLM